MQTSCHLKPRQSVHPWRGDGECESECGAQGYEGVCESERGAEHCATLAPILLISSTAATLDEERGS